METLIEKEQISLGTVNRSSDYMNVFISLIALSAMPVFFYGFSAVWLVLTGIISATVFDYICHHFFLKTKREKGDISSVITGMIVALFMPATAPFWVVIAGVLIALCVAKFPFGGTGKNIFNPAAVGIAFVTLCWPEHVLRYPRPLSLYGASAADIIYSASPSSLLSVGATPEIDYFDILLGNFAGPIGTTCMVVLGCSLLFLLMRKKVSPHIVFSAFSVLFLTSMLFPRVVTGRISSVVYEFAAGGIVFCIIFLLSDPTTAPKMRFGKILYGILFGVILFIFRIFGQTELGAVYAVIFCNMLSTSCDKYSEILRVNFSKLVGNAKSRMLSRKEKPQKIEESGEVTENA